MTPVPTKTQQDTEAAARDESGTQGAEEAAARAANDAVNDNPVTTTETTEAPKTPATEVVAKPPEKPVSAREAMRREIADRIKAQREPGTPADDVPNGMEPPPWLAKPEQDPPANDQAANDDQPKDEAKPEKSFTLKVNGNDISVRDRAELLKLAEVDEDEASIYGEAALIRLAQKNYAANLRLDEAKAAAKSAREAARAPGTTPPVDSAQDHDEPETAKAKTPAKANVKDIVEKIQFGDPEEAANDLASFIDESIDQATTQRQVQTELQSIENDVNTHVSRFEEANKEAIFGNEDRARAFYQGPVLHELKADLVASGKVTQARADELLTDPLLALKAWTAAKATGMKVRSPDALLEAARGRYERAFGPPAANSNAPGAKALADRIEAKRSLSPQPTRTSAPPPAQAPKNGQSDQSRSRAVDQMRQRRGQPSALAA